jgi:small-conductance mechanosensitive channel
VRYVSLYATLVDWVLGNVTRVVFSVLSLVVVYIAYRAVVREIKARRLEDHLTFTFVRISKWVSAIAIFSIVLAQWGITLGTVSAVLALFGGTIIGFAAVNTLGNAIAGLIVMVSRPFRVGDRVFFNEEFADVVSVDLIYTKMRTLDNIQVAIPNQELLKGAIDNYGSKNIVRRQFAITPGFEYAPDDVEEALLGAAGNVQGVLHDPKPFVWITKFGSYAVEYTLYVFINDVLRLPEIDAQVCRQILETCKKRGIDISTPLLMRQVKDLR